MPTKQAVSTETMPTILARNSPVTTASPRIWDPFAEFNRGIKRDVSQFSILKDEVDDDPPFDAIPPSALTCGTICIMFVEVSQFLTTLMPMKTLFLDSWFASSTLILLLFTRLRAIPQHFTTRNDDESIMRVSWEYHILFLASAVAGFAPAAAGLTFNDFLENKFLLHRVHRETEKQSYFIMRQFAKFLLSWKMFPKIDIEASIQSGCSTTTETHHVADSLTKRYDIEASV